MVGAGKGRGREQKGAKKGEGVCVWSCGEKVSDFLLAKLQQKAMGVSIVPRYPAAGYAVSSRICSRASNI